MHEAQQLDKLHMQNGLPCNRQRNIHFLYIPRLYNVIMADETIVIYKR